MSLSGSQPQPVELLVFPLLQSCSGCLQPANTMAVSPLALSILVVLGSLCGLSNASGIFKLPCGSEERASGKGRGHFSNVCVLEYSFHYDDGGENAWDFAGSTVRNSKFFNATFEGPQDFSGTTLENVVFDGCTFKSGAALVFGQGEPKNIKFKNCQFSRDSGVTLVNVNATGFSFEGCDVRSDLSVSSSSVSDFSVMNTDMRHFSNSLTFENSSAFGVSLTNSHFKGVNIFSTRVKGLTIDGADPAIETLKCAENAGGEVSRHSTLEDVKINGLHAENLYCPQSRWDGATISGLVLYEKVDFSGADLADLSISNVVGDSTQECQLIDFTRAVIQDRNEDGVAGKMSNMSVCKVDFTKTVFSGSFDFEGVKPMNSSVFSFEGAVLDQLCVAEQSCFDLCKMSDSDPLCKCNAEEDVDDCDKAGSNLRESDADETPGAADDEEKRRGSCFPADATVTLRTGDHVLMENLVHASSVAIGNNEHSDVFFFGHRDAAAEADYLHLTTASGDSIRLSPGHYIYANGVLKTARSVKIGDKLARGDGSQASVATISKVKLRGMYAPATVHGDLLVNGFLVSSYTDAVHPEIAHRLLSPLRFLYTMGLKSIASYANAFDRQSGAYLANLLGIGGPEVVG